MTSAELGRASGRERAAGPWRALAGPLAQAPVAPATSRASTASPRGPGDPLPQPHQLPRLGVPDADACPARISFVGKAEYMDSWKTKHIFPALGMIPIDRAGGDALPARALDAAAAVLRRGELFGIFPEGTRAATGALYQGHTGAARLALRGPLPDPARSASSAPGRSSRPTPRCPKLRMDCTIRIGRPIEVGRYQDRADDRHGPAPDHRRGDVRDPGADRPGLPRRVRDQEGRGHPDRHGAASPTSTTRRRSREPELVSAG